MINSAAKSRAINGGERLSGSGASGEKHSDGFISINTPLVCAPITHSAGVINRRVSVYCIANWGGRHYFMMREGRERRWRSLLCACAPRQRVLQTGHNFAGACTLWVEEKHRAQGL
jgi:hypothetical protein